MQIEKDDVQLALKENCGEESEITAITYDFLTFGNEYVVEYVVCANGKRYRRLQSDVDTSKFVGDGGSTNA